MNRRKFLMRAGSLTAALVVSGAAVQVFLRDEFRDAYHSVRRKLDPEYPVNRAVAELRRHFSYLEFDLIVAERYVREFFENRGVSWETDLKDFHTRFLLSTDFFPRADERRKLEYLGFYDRERWCTNRLASFVQS